MPIDLTNIDTPAPDLTPCVPPCDSGDCLGCAADECPHGEPLHRQIDGCPSCSLPWDAP